MLAVFVFMIAFFMLMGVVTALADAWMGVGRRSGRRRSLGRDRSRGAGPAPAVRPLMSPARPTVVRRGAPLRPYDGDGAVLLAEIEEWLKQQQ